MYTFVHWDVDTLTALKLWPSFSVKTPYSYFPVKKSPAVTVMLHNRFETSSNPYEEALRLMYNCLDFKNAKPKSLAFLVMDEFKTWSSCRNETRHLLTTDLKISAFNIVRQQSLFSLTKLVAEIYEFSTDSDIFLSIIKHMIKEKDYKEVSGTIG